MGKYDIYSMRLVGMHRTYEARTKRIGSELGCKTGVYQHDLMNIYRCPIYPDYALLPDAFNNLENRVY